MVSQIDVRGGGRDGAVGLPHESPSLSAARQDVPASEVKYLVTEPQAREVEARVRGRLAPDPHADPALGGAYRVTNVSFDTPRFDVYRRSAGYDADKYRTRRYGAGPAAYMERKAKQGGRVRKWRTGVPLDGLTALTDADGWARATFARQLAERDLRPVCRVTDERIALVGAGPDGPIRLTLDRSARGLAAADSRIEPVVSGVPLLAGDVILEFKYSLALPALFKEVVEALRLPRRGASKYRRCAAAFGPVAGDGGDA